METLAALAKLGQVPLGMTLEALKASGQAQQADQLSLQDMLRKQSQAQAMDPLLVEHQQLQNRGLGLQNSVQDFNLRSLGRKDRMEAELWDQTKATALTKLLASEGENKAKIFVNEIYSRLQTTPPNSPQYKALLGALQTTQSWMEKARDERYASNRQAQQSNDARKLMQMQIDAGKFKKSDKYGVSFEQRLQTLKKASEKHNTLIDAANVAEQEGNIDLALSYRARAADLRPQAEAELRMLQTPGQVDLSAPQFKIPTTPQGSIAPPAKSGRNKTASGIEYEVVND